MKTRRRLFSLACAAVVPFLFLSCGVGSEPSGSIIRVVGTSPEFLTPDLYLSICDPETGDTEPGLTNEVVTVTLKNESRPNTPEGQSTNSYVTITRYRVDFAVLDMNGSIPSLDGGGLGLGLPPDASGSVEINVLDYETREHIRNNFPSVGIVRSMRVRADITIWGVDEFGTSVMAEPRPSVTMVITDYDRCSGT